MLRERPFNLKGGYGFFPEFHIKLYDKNSESDYFVFLHQNQNIFFSNIGNQNKAITPSFKLTGRSLRSSAKENLFVRRPNSNFMKRTVHYSGTILWNSLPPNLKLILFHIKLYDKNSESDYFFFLHQNQNIFFSNIGNQNIFLEKKHTPPPFSS
jgi:hypothetical protein